MKLSTKQQGALLNLLDDWDHMNKRVYDLYGGTTLWSLVKRGLVSPVHNAWKTAIQWKLTDAGLKEARKLRREELDNGH